jgi:hypothetical protein
MFLSRNLSEEPTASYSRFPEIIGTHLVQYFKENGQKLLFLTQIGPGEVKVDLANFDLK